MKLASLKPNELAVVKDESLVPVGEILARQDILPNNFSMLDLIAQYDEIKGHVDHAARNENRKKLDAKLLKPPVEKPSKIWAAATNYKRGSEGLDDARGRGTAATATPEELLKDFFKTAVSGYGPRRKYHHTEGCRDDFPRAGTLRGHRQTGAPSAQGASFRCDLRLHDHARRHRTRLRLGQRIAGNALRAQGLRNVCAHRTMDHNQGRDRRPAQSLDETLGQWRAPTVREDRRHGKRHRYFGQLLIPGDDALSGRSHHDRKSRLAGVSEKTRAR